MPTSPGQYRVTLPDGRDLLVDLVFRDGGWLARVDGREHSLHMRRGANGEALVEVDGESYRVRGHNGSTRLVGASGEHTLQALQVHDAGRDRLARQAAPEPGPARAGSEATLHSPLTGMVLEARVAIGDEVSVGQTLFIVEAMKMENRIAAPFDAAVGEVLVAAGETVRVGAPLLRWAAGPRAEGRE